MTRQLKRAIKQSVPMTYRSRYQRADTGENVFVVWKMWLGRCYKVDRVTVAS